MHPQNFAADPTSSRPDLCEWYADRLARVRRRIDDACPAAGRDPAGVFLLAVSKTHAAADVRALYELGHRDFGENKYQDLMAKAAELADLPDLRWHFIGQLQRNKAAKVAGLASVVHSVDRLPLVAALDRATTDRPAALGVFVQFSVDGDPARGGATADDLERCAEAVATSPGLTLRGLMAAAPTGWAPEQAFARAAEAAAGLRRRYPDAVELSAGMSQDLEAAVAAGATMVRIGTDLFGPRSYA